jgi:hypothetical protein
MTVSSTTVKNSYSGDGSNDTFVYGFKIFASSDLQVIIRSATGTETTKTLTTDYTVTGVGTASGGNVVFEAAAIPTATETVVLIRNVPQTQAIDYIANDPFPAETHEEGLDRATMTIQQMQEEINRSIKLSKTNTMTSTEFTVAAADRANKILAFDSTGEISVTQELGTYKGTDTTVTTEAYVQRDIVKSTSAAQLNNVYICVGDSVVGDLLTDTDHFDLLVDAYSAASSAAAAASSATDAETAQTAAETAQTAAELAETNAETAETNAETAETNAAASEANAATSESNAATSESNAATSESNASTSASTATTQAGIATTQAGNASTSASNASTSESNAATSESNAATSESNAATSASNAATSESNAATSESNAATSASAAAASADAFDDVYLGSKSSDPTTDNDGDPLAAGMLYYNTVSNIMRIYSGSAWENVAVSTAGFTTLTGVETLTNKTLTAPKIADGGFVADANGNEQIIFTTTASAVNELTVVNSATGNAPEISSTGGDTNIDLKITPKGSGKIVLDGISFPNTDGTANQALVTDGSGTLSFASVTGRTGTVDWCTTAKTAPFTAVNGDGFFVNTTCGAVTVTLPSTPTAGDIVAFKDYAGQWNTNNVTLCNNGNKINGICATAKLSTQNQSVSLIYVDATKGWQDIQDSSAAVTGNAYITATGGTITCCGDYKIHTFTSDDTFTISAAPTPANAVVDYLVVAGGGAGGLTRGGGGAAGGYRESHCATTSGCYTASPLATPTSLPVSVQAYPVTIGAGAPDAGDQVPPAPAPSARGFSGSNSIFSTITSAGGGGGGGYSYNPTNWTGRNGGSGGGGGSSNGSCTATVAGSGNTPPVSPPQGNPGGINPNLDYGAGGGGGASAAGGNAAGTSTPGQVAGVGGAGVSSSITGSSVTRAGGGGGGGYTQWNSGGTGGGGDGGRQDPLKASTAGTVNTGGGGGGRGCTTAGGSPAGGSGIVIIRYKYQ